MFDLLSKAKSIKDVIEILGKADRTFQTERNGGTAPEDDANHGNSYKHHHLYSRRWKTLDLTVREHIDGSVDFGLTGKYKKKSRIRSA